MNFEEWKQGVPERIKADPQCKFYACPRALFLYELVWRDCEKLMKDRRGTRTSSGPWWTKLSRSSPPRWLVTKRAAIR